MQTLNAGAGKSDADYKATEQQRRADLESEGRSAADWLFGAAGLAALGTGLVPGFRVNIAVSIGAFNLLTYYSRSLNLYPFAMYAVAVIWVVILLALGLLARKGHRWAFLAAIVLYAADSIALLVTFSMLSFAVHAVFIFRWYQGQSALKEASEADAAALVS